MTKFLKVWPYVNEPNWFITRLFFPIMALKLRFLYKNSLSLRSVWGSVQDHRTEQQGHIYIVIVLYVLQSEGDHVKINWIPVIEETYNNRLFTYTQKSGIYIYTKSTASAVTHTQTYTHIHTGIHSSLVSWARQH